jgi:hypothetical protein
MKKSSGAGKGDAYRPVDYQKWSSNWDAIFPKKPKEKKALSKKKPKKD